MEHKPVPIPPDTIDIWRIPVSAQLDRLAEWQACLSPEECERADRYRFAEHRRRSIVSRGTLRKLLSGYLDVPPGRITFRANPYGKLFPADPDCRLRLNSSHSGDWVVHGFVYGDEIGIDIEAENPRVDYQQLARATFSPQEVRDIERLPAARRRSGFFACWCRKEAFLKALGRGLQIPLDGFSVTVDPDAESITVDDHGAVACGTTWHFAPLQIAPHLFGCVVVGGRPRVIRIREFP